MGQDQKREVSSLRDLSDDEFEATLAEIDGGSDRVAAILCAALLQNTLIGSIITCLKDTSEVSKLFDDRGPLNTLSGQIRMGRALGLFNGAVEAKLHIIRKVRNKFAHSAVSMDFKDRQVAGWCSGLKPFAAEARAGTISDQRRYYEDACYHFAAHLLAAGTRNIKASTQTTEERIRALRFELGAKKLDEEVRKSLVPTTLGLGGLLNLVSTSLDKDGD